LYVREGVKLERILEGQIGTQKLWPGVENTPLIVGFTVASEEAFRNFDRNVAHVKRMRDKLINGVLNRVDDVRLNGPLGEKRAPDNVNVSFLRCEGEALTIELSLKGVYVSSGSACTRRILQPSHVLLAIGREFEVAHGSILMKTTRYHTDGDMGYVLDAIEEAVGRLRSIYGSMGETGNV
nr:aminotransferase class V-fold PLP-dependent enzyme [Candidatus Bathyarchaeota archaeon]